MGWATFKRIRARDAITIVFVCIAIAVAAAILHARGLDGTVGSVLFLLIVLSLFLGAIGVTVSFWRLMTRVLPPRVGIVERLFLALSSFVLVIGCSPLALYLAVTMITQVEGSVGASGIWALLAIFSSGLFCTFAAGIFVGRTVLDWLHSRRRYSE
jgi:hypothetical protein